MTARGDSITMVFTVGKKVIVAETKSFKAPRILYLRNLSEVNFIGFILWKLAYVRNNWVYNNIY